MKNLKQIRTEKGILLDTISQVTGITIATLSNIESGVHIPNVTTRKMLERFYGEKINFLDIPIKVIPRDPPADYNDCEREFRYLLKSVASLPEQEMESFTKTAAYHLNQIFKNNNEEEYKLKTKKMKNNDELQVNEEPLLNPGLLTQNDPEPEPEVTDILKRESEKELPLAPTGVEFKAEEDEQV